MTATRWIPLVSVLCAVSVLSSCSGSDSSDSKPEASSSASPTKGSSQDPKAQKTRECKVEVALTGAVEASWTGKGSSRTASSGPDATYTAKHGKTQLAVYSDGKDFTASANVTVGQDTFTTPPADSTGITARGNGKGAELDADLSGIDAGNKTHVTATFTC